MALVASSGVREPGKRAVDWTVVVYRRTGGEWRLEIELSLDRSTTRARELLNRFKDQNPECFTYLADHTEESAWSTSFNCFRFVYYLYGELGGDAESAQRRLEIQVETGKDVAVYNRNAIGPWQLRALSLLGRREEALDLLEDLVQTGWRVDLKGGSIGDGVTNLRFNLYRNILFDAIRDHPRFQAMVAVIESDMAEQLENVREMERRGELPTLEELSAGLAAATPMKDRPAN